MLARGYDLSKIVRSAEDEEAEAEELKVKEKKVEMEKVENLSLLQHDNEDEIPSKVSADYEVAIKLTSSEILEEKLDNVSGSVPHPVFVATVTNSFAGSTTDIGIVQNFKRRLLFNQSDYSIAEFKDI